MMKKLVPASLLVALSAFAPSTAPASAPPSPAPAARPAASVDVVDGTSMSALVQTSISPLYTRRVTGGTVHEVETAVTALTIGNVDHTVGAFMKKLADWEIRTRRTTDLTTWTQRAPAKPAGATATVDPVLAANVYTNGKSPLTVYLGGLGYSSANDTQTIAVWRSTDGALTWSAPVTVAQSTTSAVVVDKPSIAVSWYLPTRGHVYVAYVLVNRGNHDLNRLYVARSTDGGGTFGAPVQVAESFLHVPQVLVSSATGKVYVVYVDYGLNKIRMATSADQGSNWTIENVTSPAGKFLDVESDLKISGNVKAVTVPHARFNWVHGSIGIVWHERQTASTSSPTDVWFIAKTASGWTARKRVNPTQANDQWMPALDFDSAGNYVVVYYDRSGDPSNLLFKQAWTQLDPVGTTLASGLVAGAFPSDPTVYRTGSGSFKGEYQDIWFWPYTNTGDGLGGRFHSFWSGTTSPTVLDDIYMSGLKP